MFLPDRLKECREDRKISQEKMLIELATNHGLEVTRGTIANWESGETAPKADQLAVLAEFFCKPVEYFFAQQYNQTG